MNAKFYLYIPLFFILFASSCINDELIGDCTDADLTVKLQLGIPGAAVEGESRDIENGVSQESQIEDVHVLVFNQDRFSYRVANPVLKSMGATKIVEAALSQSATPVTLMLLTNLNGLENKDQLLSILSQLKPSETRQEVYNKLKYTFTSAWDVNKILIPMWGECSITPSGSTSVSATVDLYRAVAKISVTVNEGTPLLDDVFQLKSVHVYHARKGGFVAPLVAPNADKAIPTVSNPSAFGQFAKNEKLEYTVSETEKYAFENKIYIPEANNVAPGTGQAAYLVIGGDYKGQFGYYRVDFKQGNVSDGEVYDAIRNYCYKFNIRSVSRPGTTDPDEAVVGLDVDIIRWNEVPMSGIGNQYTLTTDNSGYVLAFSNTVGAELNLTTTYYAGWTITNQVGDWFTVVVDEKTASTGKLTIRPNGENMGTRRYGSFYIQSGNLKKRISIRQDEQSTSNCYISADPESMYEIVVTIKGNGTAGIYPEGMNGASLIDPSDVALATDHVAILWETGEGLVTLTDAVDGKAKPSNNGVIKYKVNPEAKLNNKLTYGMSGGNALIGAFDKDKNLIWSWHIWVCSDYANGGVENRDQKWATGYRFNDRNLGAISASPGVPSLGLLYQWGRKDPFVGPGEIKSATTTKITTKNYTVNNVSYAWANGQKSNDIPYGITNPTKLMPAGLSTAASVGEYLWGTNAGFVSGETNLGIKTIYDPCPVGYRLPPVDAYVFSSNGESSMTDNYDKNMVFWPNNVYTKDVNYPSAKYVEDKYTDSYGFWLNFGSHSNQPNVPDFGWSQSSQTRGTPPAYKANVPSIPNATWLPVSGVYDGDLSGFAEVDSHSSITVNSVIWTNSPMNALNNIRRPGGLFLHGTEYRSLINGRHWHKMDEGNSAPDLAAKPQFAAAVRCIRDVKKDFGTANSITNEIELGATQGSTAQGSLISFNDRWEVVDPGAMWVYMTPDEGGSSGKAQPITFTASENNPNNTPRVAYIKVRFENGVEQTVKVTQAQAAKPRKTFTPASLTVSASKDIWYTVIASASIQKITVKSYSSGSGWLEVSSSGTEIYIKTKRNNGSDNTRKAILSVTFNDKDTASYTVTQEGDD